jgi:hypothetical protein
MSKSSTTHWLRDSSSRRPVLDFHHQYALLQYGKALRGMRLAIDNHLLERRVALIACLLVFCLECLLGHHQAASRYAASSISLLEGCDTNTESSFSLVEDDIYAAWSGLDLQRLILFNFQSPATHQHLMDEIEPLLQLMPTTFTKLKECRAFWQLVMRKSLHFLNMMYLLRKFDKFSHQGALRAPCKHLFASSPILQFASLLKFHFQLSELELTLARISKPQGCS